MDPFDCRDYRDALRVIFLTRTKALRFTQSELAERIHIQPPFLSKVFSKRAHFCRDQLDLCISSLSCQPRLSQFVFLLHDFNLSKNFERREKLLKEVVNFARDTRSVSDLAVHSNRETNFAGYSRYFSNPIYSLVHMALTIEEFRRNPILLTNTLQISAEQLDKSIETLHECQLLDFDVGGEIRLLSKFMQIQRNHEQFDSWRLSILGLMTFLEKTANRKNSIQVQGFFSVPNGASTKIKEKIIHLLSELKDLSESGCESKLVALSLNYFEVT